MIIRMLQFMPEKRVLPVWERGVCPSKTRFGGGRFMVGGSPLVTETNILVYVTIIYYNYRQLIMRGTILS